MTESSWWVESWLTGAGNAIVNNNNGRLEPRPTARRSTASKSVAIHQWMQKMYAADLIDLVPDTRQPARRRAGPGHRKSAMLIESSTSIADIDALRPARSTRPSGACRR